MNSTSRTAAQMVEHIARHADRAVGAVAEAPAHLSESRTDYAADRIRRSNALVASPAEVAFSERVESDLRTMTDHR